MTVEMVPSTDLTASLASRVVVINLVDLLEGDYAAGEWVDIILAGDIHVPGTQNMIPGGRLTRVPLPEGRARGRPPGWAAADGDWSLMVKKSWAPHWYQMRVPSGSGEIALSEIPAL